MAGGVDSLREDARAPFTVSPVGFVRRTGGTAYIEILQQYRPALKHLQQFSHSRVCWWCSEYDCAEARSTVLAGPRQNRVCDTGVFACRSPRRPNPLALTTVRVLDVDEASGVVHIGGIDAFTNTPVLDMKPYVPAFDRVERVRMPDWLPNQAEWFPEQEMAAREATRGETKRTDTATYELHPVGYIDAPGHVVAPGHVDATTKRIVILKHYVQALQGLEEYSHLNVLWWFDRSDAESQRNVTQCTPPYQCAPVAGAFATRSPTRPNPIGLTTVRILEIDGSAGVVHVGGLDAFDGTAVLDLKGYVSSSERVEQATVPQWLDHLPEWLAEISSP